MSSCPFAMPTTEDELKSLRWVQEILTRLAKRHYSESSNKAIDALRIISRMQDHLFEMHTHIHALEDDMKELSQELEGVEMIDFIAKEDSGKHGPN